MNVCAGCYHAYASQVKSSFPMSDQTTAKCVCGAQAVMHITFK